MGASCSACHAETAHTVTGLETSFWKARSERLDMVRTGEELEMLQGSRSER
jgi:hypothetical protein